MLKPRIIPCLLVHKKGLVKTNRFRSPKYVGDPLNAVKIFNEKEVDELIVLDIDATSERRQPDYSLIENLAAECRMPFCYGGGIKTEDQALKIVQLGVEKIGLSSILFENPALVSKLARKLGRQSIVAVVDVKRANAGYEIYVENGTRSVKINLFNFLRELESLGIGEIVVNSIDRDGAMIGYDIELMEKVRNIVDVPITALGGAGHLGHIAELIERFGPIGAAAGSLFVYKGIYKAVLINYPSIQDREYIWNACQPD